VGDDTGGRRRRIDEVLAGRAVDVVVVALVAGWALYALRITDHLTYWSDDLSLVQQSGSFSDWFEPYNGHMSLAILALYRVAAEVSDFSYRPFTVIGVAVLAAVPLTYFATTRRQLGPLLAGLLALPLLLYPEVTLRAAGLNHYLVLVGAFVAAAALDRGRRADPILAGGVLLALCSAGGGLVVAGACLLHNLLTRAPLRRWVAVLVPLGLWGLWWVTFADAVSPGNRPLETGETARTVVEFLWEPFEAAALGVDVLAAVLLAGFVAYGAFQLRRGLVEGANFLTWTAAVVAWAVALMRSRADADADIFRYGYLALGFALLAVVPRRPVRWTPAGLLARWRVPAVAAGALAAAVVLVVGGGRALAVRDDMQYFARSHVERSREAEGTFLALSIGPEAIPDDQPITFFGYNPPHGTAGELRALIERYGSPEERTGEEVDRELVDRKIARGMVRGKARPEACLPIEGDLAHAGTVTPGLGALPRGGRNTVQRSFISLRVWAAKRTSVEVRRFGDEWVHLFDIPRAHRAVLRLPALDSDEPWELRAEGICVFG
jgi:hypothetical protein